MPGPELRQEMEFSVQQRLELQMDQALDIRQQAAGALDAMKSVAPRSIKELLAQSQEPIARRVLRSPLLQQDFLESVLRRVSARFGKELADIVRSDPKWSVARERLRSKVEEIIPDIIKAALRKERIPAPHDDLARVMIARSGDGGCDTPALEEKAIVHPLRVQDLPDAEYLYEGSRITRDIAIALANREQVTTNRILLRPFRRPADDHRKHIKYEWEFFEEMLKRTAILSRKKTRAKQLEKETVYGTCMRHPLTNELLALAVDSRSPLNPEDDHEFEDREEGFIEEGVSGGVVNYVGQNDKQKQRRKEGVRRALLGGNSSRLVFMASRKRGFGMRARAINLMRMLGVNFMENHNLKTEQEGVINPNTARFTYWLDEVIIQFDGDHLEDGVRLGENCNSKGSLKEGGWPEAFATDSKEDWDNPAFQFEWDVGRDRHTLAGEAVWASSTTTVQSEINAFRLQLANSAPVQLKG